MFRLPNRFTRWMLMISSGAVLFGMGGGCQFFEAAQTGLLAVLTGAVLFLARNV